MTRPRFRRLGVSLAAAILTATLHSAAGARSVPAAAPVLHDVRGTADVRARFEQDRGHVRILMLLSPT
jgi:hypothetical protein